MQSWKGNPRKPVVNPYTKRYVNLPEIDESNIASAAPEVYMNHDNDEQDEIFIFSSVLFFFLISLKIKDKKY